MSDADLHASKSQELITEYKRQIANKRRWQRNDFLTSQTIAWLSLLCSASITIWTAAGVGSDGRSKTIAAILTAIPGLMVAIESGFNFSQRSKLNAAARYDISLMVDALERGDDPFEINKQYVDYMKRFHDIFTSGATVPKASKT